MLAIATEHRMLRLLEKAGAQGLMAREFAAIFWAGKEQAKKPRAVCCAGRMLCELVDRGYASRMGAERHAVHVLQEPGRRRLAELAREEAEQAARNAAAFERSSAPGKSSGPWF